MGEELKEDFNFLKEIGKEKRTRNAFDSTQLLTHQGIPFRVLNEVNHHYLVMEKFDFWPSTGKWRERQSGRWGRGVSRLIELVRKVGLGAGE